MNQTKCTDCGAKIDVFDTFPGNRCVVCHAKIADREPLPDPMTMANEWKNVVAFNELTN